jgi:N-sulfoglucosamine sulfohydrolase
MSHTILLLALSLAAPAQTERPNFLIITVDDMSADSLGAFGCQMPGTSPNIDRLASTGLRFNYAHVQVGNCMPSRNAMWSGRYPHNNGVEGFYQVRDIDYPVLCDLMKSAGYFTAIRGKVGHSTPYSPYAWDLNLDRLPGGEQAHPKEIASYKISTEQGIRAAQAAGKPFCVMINVSDPHKPFYAEGRNGETVADPHVPSRVFTPEEVPIPGFLFDDPVVRKELSHYYSSVRRADDCVGEVLKALDASGEADRTLVMFLSDHGMPLPFAKTQLYHHSTRTPLVIRWPGVTRAAAADDTHMISAVDFLPTILDIAGVPHPDGLDGRSFAPLLTGEAQDGRDMVFKEYNENAGGSRDPMRGVETKRFLYLFNPWSNGERVMRTATQGTSTYRRMRALAGSDRALAARLEVFDHRVVEELYDVENDPDCLKNLIDDPAHQAEAARLREALEAWMVKTADPMLEVFRGRDDPAIREAYMTRVETESAERGPRKARAKEKAKPKAKTRKTAPQPGSRAPDE